MTRIDFPYLMSDRDRHGNDRLYVRRHRRKIRIREKPGTEAFARSYADALQVLDRGLTDRAVLKGAPAGTLGWLAACYFASVEFRRLDPKSQSTRRRIIEDCLREPRKPGSCDLMRDCPLSVLSAAHVKMREIGRPGHRPPRTTDASTSHRCLAGLLSTTCFGSTRRARCARSVTPHRDFTPGRSMRFGNSSNGIPSAPRRD